MVNYLRSGAKDTSAAAAKDRRRHLAKGRVIDNEQAVDTREERMQKDAVKAQKAKNREIKQQAAAAAAKPVASSEKRAQKEGHWVQGSTAKSAKRWGGNRGRGRG